MDIQRLRSDFPFFKNHPDALYWDNAATTHKPKEVIEAITSFYENHNANIHRGVHALTEYATEQYEKVRDEVAEFINAADRSEIVFTRGATEGINMVADSWVRPILQKTGGTLVTTIAEHHAHFLPWQRLAELYKGSLSVIPLNKETFFLDSTPEKYITADTRFVALTLDSNVLGSVWEHGLEDVKNYIKAAHAMGAQVLLDASQYIAHHRLDVQKLGADFVVFSGHKMMAPTGVGVLYVNKSLHDRLEPYHVGGSMVYSASLERSLWKEMPYRFEAGTPAIASVLGLGAALSYIKKNKVYENLNAHEAALCAEFIKQVEKNPAIRIVGNKERLKKEGHLVSFVIDGVHAHDVAAWVSSNKLSVRAGHLCAQPLCNALGYDALLRASFYLYTTSDEIKQGVSHIMNCITALQK